MLDSIIVRYHWRLYVDKAASVQWTSSKKFSQKSDSVSQLKPEGARNLALAAEYLDVPANTLICSEGDQADNMYFIATGLIQVFMGKDQAQPQ